MNSKKRSLVINLGQIFIASTASGFLSRSIRNPSPPEFYHNQIPHGVIRLFHRARLDLHRECHSDRWCSVFLPNTARNNTINVYSGSSICKFCLWAGARTPPIKSYAWREITKLLLVRQKALLAGNGGVSFSSSFLELITAGYFANRRVTRMQMQWIRTAVLNSGNPRRVRFPYPMEILGLTFKVL